MLNTKYFVFNTEEQLPAVQLNPDALGNAWFVGQLEVADDARAESDALRRIDLRTTAVVDRSFAGLIADTEPGIAPDASVQLSGFTPKQLDYDCTSSTPGTIVFSEIYYPYGWKATIDGEPAEHFRVNYVLRALNVPEGSHHIRFVFDPDSVRKGDRIATACVVLMYLFILGAIILGLYACIKNRRNAAAPH